MFDQVGPDLTTGGHEVHHAGRQPGLDDRLGEQEAVEHGLWARLHDDGATRSEQRPELEHRKRLRVVPRHDRPDHANGLAQYVNGAAEQPGAVFLERRLPDQPRIVLSQQGRKDGLDLQRE